MKKMKEVPSTKGDGGVNQRKVVLPHEGGLLLPNGAHFPESALKSLDFTRAMSFMSGQ